MTVRAAGDLPALSVRRPYLATVVNLLIILAGISAVFGVELRELPDVDRPIVTVRANYPGGSPETIDAEITSVIEAAVARVNGVKAVRSSSEENNLRIRAEFNPSVDLIDAANDIREAVSRVERDLPDGVEDITVIKADADAQPIIQLSAFSESLAIDELTRVVEDEVVPELTSVEGVAEVNLFGTRERVLRVIVDPIKLASYRLSVADIAAVLKQARYDVPAGSFKSGDQEVLVRANASVATPEGHRKADPARRCPHWRCRHGLVRPGRGAQLHPAERPDRDQHGHRPPGAGQHGFDLARCRACRRAPQRPFGRHHDHHHLR